MLGVPAFFRTLTRNRLLRRLPPAVLQPEEARVLHADLGQVEGPAELGLPAIARSLSTFNPSLVVAPPGLACPLGGTVAC